jgi:hypothetical protein
MDDLQALAKSKSWLELTQHITDILPSKRDQEWDKLANLAFESRFKELHASDDTKNILKFLSESFPKYPKLKNNKAFMKLRADFGIRYYESCFSYNDEACHKELLGFVELDPNPSYALQVAKLVRKRMSNNKAIEYFAIALSKKPEQSICNDTDLKISLESAIQSKPASNYANAAKKVAFGQCFDSLKSTMKTAVKNSDNAKTNACEELLSKNALKGISKKKCERFIKK